MFHIMSGGGYMTLYNDHNFNQIIYIKQGYFTVCKVVFSCFFFLAALGICCCAWAFSSVGAGASHCRGSSCCRAWARGCRLSSRGARA